MSLPRPSQPRLEPLEWAAELAREAMKSSPANVVNMRATMAHNRLVSKAMGMFSQTILLKFEDELTRRDVEIAVLRTCWNCGSEYTFGQHGLVALVDGVTEAELYDATRPISQGHWTPAEAAMLQLVDDLCADDCVSDAAWAAASQHYGAADICQLLAVSGCYRMVCGFNNSAGVQLEEGVPGWPSPPHTHQS